jgi:hypothetical protein
MPSSGMLRRVARVRIYVSEELSASIIKVTNFSRNKQPTHAAKLYIPPNRRFLQEPHGVTSQKTPFFIVTAVKTSNLTYAAHKFACFRSFRGTYKIEVKIVT